MDIYVENGTNHTWVMNDTIAGQQGAESVWMDRPLLERESILPKIEENTLMVNQ